MRKSVFFLLLLILGGCKSKSLELPATQYEVMVGGYPRCEESEPLFADDPTGPRWNWRRRADGHCYKSDAGSAAFREDTKEWILRMANKAFEDDARKRGWQKINLECLDIPANANKLCPPEGKP